ncbi:MAG TPA: winged helix-turn-helix domain-containing protein [Bryobacteraceae bacterium]|nr:winged helix-turn-helix domain-containing protein [Bryobacteraceae bacterium]
MQELGKTRKNSETANRKLLYEFGPFRVDPQKRLLLQDGRPVPLTGKALDILLALLECHGEILTKDELIGRVWPDTVVEEGNLGRNISSLRKALDESPDEHRYIVTLARRGYRFVADVRERWEENGIAAGPAEVKPFPAPGVGALPPASTSPRRWRRWSMVAPVTLLALLILFGAIVSAHRWARGRGRRALEPVPRQLTANPTENWVMGAGISPDGKYLAFLDRTGLFVRSIDSGETHPIALPPEWIPGNITGLRWFPDGGKLSACVRTSAGYGIWAITAVGQAAPRLIQRSGLWPAISPDGRSIAFQNGDPGLRGSDLWVAGIHGEAPRKLLAAEDGDMALSPVWSPDGRWIAYLKGREDKTLGGQFDRTASIEMRPANGGPARTVVSGASLPPSTFLFCMHGRGCLSWSQDGRLFFPASDRAGTQLTRFGYSIWAVPVEVRTGDTAGKPVRLAQWADFYPNCLTLTADGKRLVFLKSRIQLDVYVGKLGIDGGSLSPPRRLTLDNRGLGSAPHGWTRDSRAILFISDRNGNEEVFKQGPSENLAQAVVQLPGYEQRDPSPSPDGSWILYRDRVHSGSQPDAGPQRLMRLPAAGGSPEVVLELPAAESFDYRCPLKTGSCVLSQKQGRDLLFYALDPVRGKGSRLGKTDRWAPRMLSWAWDVSPDGSRLAVVGSGNNILTLANGVWHEVPVAARWEPDYIAWAADGGGFFATSSTLDLLHVTTAGKVNVLSHNDHAQWPADPVPSPDGKYLAFQAQTYDFNAWMIDNP